MQRDHLFEKDRFRARNVPDGLPRHGLRQEADEVAGMAGLEDDADLAVGLEPADARTVAGARIDHDKRPARRIDLDTGRRNNPRQAIIHRPFQRAAIDDQLNLVVENVRRRLFRMLAERIAALPHDIQEQQRALRRVRHVFECRSKAAEIERGWCVSSRVPLVGHAGNSPKAVSRRRADGRSTVIHSRSCPQTGRCANGLGWTSPQRQKSNVAMHARWN